MGGTMYERIGGDWVGHLLTADNILRMPEIDIEVPIAELYEGVALTPAEPAAATQALIDSNPPHPHRSSP